MKIDRKNIDIFKKIYWFTLDINVEVKVLFFQTIKLEIPAKE